MKEILAILFVVCFGTILLYLTATKQLAIKATIPFLVFTIAVGFLIANHDFIKKIKYKDIEIEAFERQITGLKEKAIEEIRNDVSNQKRMLNSLVNDADQSKLRIEQLHSAISNLALLQAKITYLQAQTKNEFGTERVKIAFQEIDKELNTIIEVIIPDPQERKKWVADLQHILPQRK